MLVSTFWSGCIEGHPKGCCGCLNGRLREDGSLEIYCNECGEIFMEFIARREAHDDDE